MKKSTKNNSKGSLIENEVLPYSIFTMYSEGLTALESMNGLFDDYSISKITIREFRDGVFSKSEPIKTSITYLCDYFISQVPNKDSIKDVLLDYACVFYFFYRDIEVVLNNIHNKAFNLTMNATKKTEANYLEFVENYLSTLTPKLTEIKEAVKEYAS